ncbi:Fc.00g013270.m01.CDS01 [Cosmosporella sp. VM-42]
MGVILGRNTRVASIAATTILFFGLLGLFFRSSGPWTRSGSASSNDAYNNKPRQKGLQVAVNDKDYGRISNQTLGFEQVIAIGMEERSDKRDAMALMSALTGFKVDWVNGVKPSTIPTKAVPYGIDGHKTADNFLGTWRGHMDALRKIVDTGISSALILEDDMDWDVHLKGQLDAVARGARHVLRERSSMPESPYGDNWDILWLGHCGEPFPETLQENVALSVEAKSRLSGKYVIHNDMTVPPSSKISRLVDWSRYPAHTRVVHLTAAPICSFSYAVTQRGARKLLYALSINGLHMAFDNSLAQLCRDSAGAMSRGLEERGLGIKCISVNPTIMFHHKAKGPVSADTDLQSMSLDGRIRGQGVTESIKYSMRMNLENMLMGKPPQAQYKEGPLDGSR